MPNPTIISAAPIPSPVRLNVPNPAQVAQFFDRIQVFRSTSATGVFTEITNATTRPRLDPATTEYDYFDPTGLSTHFYQFQYLNTSTGATSPASAVQAATGDPYLDVISVADLKLEHLFGLDLSDESGNPMPDAFFEFYIKSAIDYLSRILDLPILQEVIVSETHDFIVQDYNKFIYMQLNRYPVLSIQQIRLVLPGNQTVITYDPSWIFPDLASGQVMIVPGSGSGVAVAIGLSTLWLPLTQGLHRFVPDVFQVDYTAGFVPGQVPAEIKRILGRLAAIGPLSVLGDLIFGAGVAGNNIGLDGLMTSIKTTKSTEGGAFHGRIIQYRKDIEEGIHEIRRYYKGARFVVG